MKGIMCSKWLGLGFRSAFGMPVPHSLAFKWQQTWMMLFSSIYPKTAMHMHAGLLTHRP